MAPKHKSPQNRERTAVAPYNFIPVPDRVIAYPEDHPQNPLNVDQDIYHSGRYTGWIDVQLETRSPIYVRGPLTPPDYELMEKQENDPNDKTPHLQKIRNRPSFFHTGDPNSPVIPGSSLRGMLRTMVEVLGHGKLTPVMEAPLIYRAVGDTSSHGEAYRQALMDEDPHQKNHFTPKFKGGYIRKDGNDWYIQPAEEINGVSYARIAHKRIPQGRLNHWHDSKNASQIFVKIGDYEFQDVRGGFVKIRYAKVLEASPDAAPSLKEAALVRSGHMFSKRSEAVIFAPDKSKDTAEQWIRIPDGSDETDKQDLVAAYKDQISPEQAGLLGKDGVLRNLQPVLYLMRGNKLVFFGHTQMFRFPYPRAPKDFLSPVHNDETRIDFAEAMFGKAKRGSRKDEDGGGQAGRVFVSEARLESGQNDVWLPDKPVVIPKILSGPKPTTFQHYLTQSRPDVPKGKGLHTYNDSPKQTTLRGYKYYWHKGNVQRRDFAEDDRQIDMNKDTQHTQMKPVCSGVTFSFRVHFENLLPAELGLLWWAVALPAAGEHCHKMGMGKPLGLGAIKLTPALHLVDMKENARYKSLFAKMDKQPDWETGLQADPQEVLGKAVANFEDFVLTVSEHPTGLPFAETPRVKMLLKMLAWPGPDPEETRYMEIERPDSTAKRGKTNEYK